MEILHILAPIAVLGFLAFIRWKTLVCQDRHHIRRHAKENGWTLLHVKWSPLLSKHVKAFPRLYRVGYHDADGNLREANLTRRYGGDVLVISDQIVNQPSTHPSGAGDRIAEGNLHPVGNADTGLLPVAGTETDADSLAEENRRLRMRIRELENREP